MMFREINHQIELFSVENISTERLVVLQPLVNYIQSKRDKNQSIPLNFICTHNSRRSHLCQIWAQTMAYHYEINNIFCYSGGTKATAMFPKVAETLTNQGFQIQKLSTEENPIYAIKFDENENPIICFSKEYSHAFNPKNMFGAIMTCNNADIGCPVVLGAEVRFPIKYDDPKDFDNTEIQTEKYRERSLKIAQEMWWVFSQIK